MSLILAELSTLVERYREEIEDWFHTAYQGTQPPFYSSVDLRHSGRKLAPVDTNLFPAGFNNLNDQAMKRATESVKRFFDRYFPDVHNLLLIPEGHTRNLYYLDNVHCLYTILTQAGKQVALGNIKAETEEPLTMASLSGHSLTLYPLYKKDDQLQTRQGFIPDLVLLNNDLTGGMPELLANIRQPILPSLEAGWHIRRKSVHFATYNQLVRAFAERFPIDPFLISTLFNHCGKVNFKERTGMECVALSVEKLLHELRQKYAAHGITDQPYVFIKADNGTYGMGIMTAHSGDELYDMNKKLRNKMGVIKEGVMNTEVIIQEGIPTIDRIEGDTAEPMIYLTGGDPVGCLYRVNTEHDAFSNLNAHGMRFEKSVCEAITGKPFCKLSPFGLVARLASLAASKEQYPIL